MKTTFIYALCEPGTRTVRYIGKSNTPKYRLKYGHLLDSILLTTHLGRWLQRVVRSGKTPNLVILAEVPRRSWKTEERRYIANARMLGMNLVNSTDGGEGVTQTPETRKKIGDANRGKPCPLAQRKKISKTLTGRKLPRAHRRAIGKGVLGTRHTPKSRRNYRLSKLGKRNPMFGKSGPAHPSFGVKQKGASSKFFGVSWYNHTNRWVAQVSGVRIGYFLLEKDAARAYDKVATSKFGRSVKTNFSVKCRE